MDWQRVQDEIEGEELTERPHVRSERSQLND
jgi:hypothetical protein